MKTVVEGGPLRFLSASEALFGERPGQRATLFVCNFANDHPKGSGIL
jgi:hypothetical protein